MIGGERGRDPKHIGSGFLDVSPDVVPSHPEVIIPAVKLEGAAIVRRIEFLEVRQFRRDRKGPLRFCLSIEYLNLLAVFSQGGGQIGQTDGLGPD
jgi:hypothetical protein